MQNKLFVSSLFASGKIQEKLIFPPLLANCISFPDAQLSTDTKVWLLITHNYMSKESLVQSLIKCMVRELENVYNLDYTKDYLDNLYSLIKKINSISTDDFILERDKTQFYLSTDEIFKSWISRRFFENFARLQYNEQVIVPTLRVLKYSYVFINLFLSPEEETPEIFEGLLL